MKTILILSSCGLRDALQCVSDHFISLHYTVKNYSLFQESISKTSTELIAHLSETIRTVSPDILLWWFSSMDVSLLSSLRSSFPSLFFLLYAFHDPRVSYWKDKLCFFDLVLSSSEEMTRLPKTYSISPGFDPNIFHPPPLDHPIQDDQYRCDISFCCQDIYDPKDYPSQYIPRHDLIQRVSRYCSSHGLVFHLYGPDFLRGTYPDSYQSYIDYSHLCEVFQTSRINLSTHKHLSKGYMNTHTLQILASGSLCFVDPIDHPLLQDSKNCIVMQKQFLESQLDQVFSFPSSYTSIRNQAHQDVSQLYTWKEWIRLVHGKLCDMFFHESFYRKTFCVPDHIDARIYFKDQGILKNHIPYLFPVPITFDFVRYASQNSISDRSKEYIYWYYLQYHHPSSSSSFSSSRCFPSSSTSSSSSISSVAKLNGWNLLSSIESSCSFSVPSSSLMELSKWSSRFPDQSLHLLLEQYLSL